MIHMLELFCYSYESTCKLLTVDKHAGNVSSFPDLYLCFRRDNDAHVRDCARSYTEDWAIVNRR